MSERTGLLLAAELAAARAAATRAVLAVALFVVWLCATWLGPRFEPAGGFTVVTTLLALCAYGLLSAATAAALASAGLRPLRSAVLRRLVSRHLAPFGLVLAAALAAGGAVAAAADGSVLAACLGAGTGLSILASAHAAARLLEVPALRDEGRALDARADAALERELRRRLSA